MRCLWNVPPKFWVTDRVWNMDALYCLPKIGLPKIKTLTPPMHRREVALKSGGAQLKTGRAQYAKVINLGAPKVKIKDFTLASKTLGGGRAPVLYRTPAHALLIKSRTSN